MQSKSVGQGNKTSYTVISKFEDIEIRQYPQIIVANIEVEGQRDKSVSEGFSHLFSFINGNNSKNIKIKMTIPVLQYSSLKYNHWYVSFLMPKKFTLKSLPSPNNKNIKIQQLTTRKLAAITFSGFVNEANLAKHQEKLEVFLKKQKLKAASKPMFAFYNRPWSLPFLKHNEVLIEIE
jgi:DNA gyrase inhibitor GyrI